MTALHDIPDSVFRNDGLWRQWYDAEAPETANVPDYEDRLSKFERMCVVKVCLKFVHQSTTLSASNCQTCLREVQECLASCFELACTILQFICT